MSSEKKGKGIPANAAVRPGPASAYSFRFSAREAAADAARPQAAKDAENADVSEDSQDEESDVFSLADDSDEEENSQSEQEDDDEESESGDSSASADPLVFEDKAGAENPQPATTTNSGTSAIKKTEKPPIELAPHDRARLDRMILKYVKRVRSITMRKIRRRRRFFKEAMKKIAGQGKSQEIKEDEEKLKKKEKKHKSAVAALVDENRSSEDYQHLLTALEGDYAIAQKISPPKVAAVCWSLHWQKNKEALNRESLVANGQFSLEEIPFVAAIVSHTIIKERFEHINKMALKKLKRQKAKAGRKIMQKEKVKLKKSTKSDEAREIRDLVAKKIEEKFAERGEKLPDNYRELIKTRKPSKIKVGYVADCLVTNVADFGVFLEFWHRVLPRSEPVLMNGLCHGKDCGEERLSGEQIKKKFHVGDKIRACVYRIEHPKKRGLMKSHMAPEEPKLFFTLKQQYFPSDSKPEVQKLAIAAEKKGEAPESAFVGSLKHGGSSQAGGSERLATMEKFMTISQGQKSGKNRLGQRERRKLSEAVFGKQAVHVQERKNNEKSPEKRGRQEENPNRSRPDHKRKREESSEPRKARAPEPVAAVDPSIHPSWAAKAAEKSAKAEGKRVKL